MHLHTIFLDRNWHERTSQHWPTCRGRSRRHIQWQKSAEERRWDIHWNMEVRASTYGSVLLVRSSWTWLEVIMAAFFLSPCHCNPLKKLKLLEMSQSKVFVGKEKPSSLHSTPHCNINLKIKIDKWSSEVIQMWKELKATSKTIYFHNNII